MFTNVGWGEIIVIFIIGLIVVGPERLPKIIEDARAALFAARKAINEAKQNLNGEFGPEFDEFRKPLADLATLQRMGPRAALTKTLLDGDDSLFDSFDPRKPLATDDVAANTDQARAQLYGTAPQGNAVPASQVQPPQQHNPAQSANNPGQQNQGGDFSWADIT